MKLSASQLAMLDAVRRTGRTTSHLSGRSAHGGAIKTRASLVRLGLLRPVYVPRSFGGSDLSHELTDAGFAALPVSR